MHIKVNFILPHLFILLFSSVTLAQTPILERLIKINRLLQPSEEFHEMSDKQSLIITEQHISRTLYHQLVSKNLLRNQNGFELPKKTLQALTGKLSEGSLLFYMEKYYDGEIENLFTVMTGNKYIPNFSALRFQPLSGGDLKSSLTPDTYTLLKNQKFSSINITRKKLESYSGNDFLFDLHFFRPEILFWKPEENKYVYLFGKWGADELLFPGWFYPAFIYGFRYADQLVKPGGTTNNFYSIEGGIGAGVNSPSFLEDEKNRNGALSKSTGSIYFSADLNLNYLLNLSQLEDMSLRLKFSGLASLERNSFPDVNPESSNQHFVNKDYYSFSFILKNNIDPSSQIYSFTSLGISYYNIQSLGLDQVSQNQIIEKEIENNYLIILETGIGDDSYFLNYKGSVNFSYDLSQQYGYIGLKGFFLINNTFGFSLSFNSAFSDKLPSYRSDLYAVFSPWIRLSY